MAAAALLLGQVVHLKDLTLFGLASSDRDPLGVAWSLDIEHAGSTSLSAAEVALAARATPATVIGLALLAAAGGVWLEQASGVVTIAKYAPLFLAGMLTHTARWRPNAGAADVSLATFAGASLLTAFTPFVDKLTPDPFDRTLRLLLAGPAAALDRPLADPALDQPGPPSRQPQLPALPGPLPADRVRVRGARRVGPHQGDRATSPSPWRRWRSTSSSTARWTAGASPSPRACAGGRQSLA